MGVTEETRRESYKNLDNTTMNNNIIDVLRGKKVLTAREISIIMYQRKLIPFPVRQAVAPRLTELEAAGIVETVSKVYDEETKRKVASYSLVK